MLDEFIKVDRGLKLNKSDISIDLDYRDNNNKLYLTLTTNTTTTTNDTNNYEFVLESSNYPRKGVTFYADWTGSCSTPEYCYWVENVSNEVNSKYTTVTQTINVCIKWYRITQIEYNKYLTLMSEESLYYEGDLEYDPGVEETPTIERRIGVSNLKPYLLSKYKKSSIKIEILPDSKWLVQFITINSNNNNNISNNDNFDNNTPIIISLNIDVTVMNEITPPKISLISPRIIFDGVFPITNFGCIIIDGLTPLTWKEWILNQINSSYDLDFIAFIKRAFDEIPFKLDEFDKPYDQSESFIGYDRLLRKEHKKDTSRSSLNSFSLMPRNPRLAILRSPRSSYSVVEPTFNRVMKCVGAEDDDTNVRFSARITESLIDKGLGAQDKPLFEIETITGLKSVCGMGNVHYLSDIVVIVPKDVMKNLLISNKSVDVKISYVTLNDATLLRIRMLDTEDISRELLEDGLSQYSAVSEGEVLSIDNRQVEIIECDPDLYVRVTKFGYTNVEIDILSPTRYQENKNKWSYGALTVPRYSYESDEESEDEGQAYRL